MKPDQSPKQKAVKLFLIWAISFLGLNTVSAYKNLSRAAEGKQHTSEIQPDGFLLFVLLVTGAYFIPMLFAICRRAKLEQIKWLETTAKVLSGHLIVTLVFAIIILLFVAHST